MLTNMKTHRVQALIKQTRKHARLTQMDLAERTGLNYADIANYETRLLPPLDKLDAIAKALGKRVVIELRRVR